VRVVGAGAGGAGAGGVSEVLAGGGARVGLLRLGPRADGRAYAPRERAALRAAAAAVAEAIAGGPRPAGRGPLLVVAHER